jgi:hypothetical protein
MRIASISSSAQIGTNHNLWPLHRNAKLKAPILEPG